MPLTNDSVIWINDKYGVALDEYEGKVKLQGVTKYKKDGSDVLVWDWIYRATWNKDTKTREVPAKANGVSGISLGTREEAIKALGAFLRHLGGTPALEEEDMPF